MVREMKLGCRKDKNNIKYNDIKQRKTRLKVNNIKQRINFKPPMFPHVKL